jgi:hypothetical protein
MQKYLRGLEELGEHKITSHLQASWGENIREINKILERKENQTKPSHKENHRNVASYLGVHARPGVEI